MQQKYEFIGNEFKTIIYRIAYDNECVLGELKDQNVCSEFHIQAEKAEHRKKTESTWIS